MRAFPGGLKIPTRPMCLKASKPNGLAVWENVWEQKGEGERLMAKGLCSGHS